MRRMAMSRLPLAKSNIARVVERTQLNESLSTDTAYWFTAVLNGYSRASAVAANYKWYRLASIKYTYMPNALATIGATGPAAGLKHIYYNMERTGLGVGPVYPTISLDYFMDNGSKPIPFGSTTGKSVVIKYKPNLLDSLALATDATNTNANLSEPVFNKWIPTFGFQPATPSDPPALNDMIEYNGHSLWCDSTGSSPIVDAFSYTVEAVWEFKDPIGAFIDPEGAPATIKLR